MIAKFASKLIWLKKGAPSSFTCQCANSFPCNLPILPLQRFRSTTRRIRYQRNLPYQDCAISIETSKRYVRVNCFVTISINSLPLVLKGENRLFNRHFNQMKNHLNLNQNSQTLRRLSQYCYYFRPLVFNAN